MTIPHVGRAVRRARAAAGWTGAGVHDRRLPHRGHAGGLSSRGVHSIRRFVESTLFGLTAADPLTYVVVAGLLVGVTLLAALRLAQRAARVDPMIALRAE